MDLVIIGTVLVAVFVASVAFETVVSRMFVGIGSRVLSALTGGRFPPAPPGHAETFVASLVGFLVCAAAVALVVIVVRSTGRG